MQSEVSRRHAQQPRHASMLCSRAAARACLPHARQLHHCWQHVDEPEQRVVAGALRHAWAAHDQQVADAALLDLALGALHAARHARLRVHATTHKRSGVSEATLAASTDASMAACTCRLPHLERGSRGFVTKERCTVVAAEHHVRVG